MNDENVTTTVLAAVTQTTANDALIEQSSAQAFAAASSAGAMLRQARDAAGMHMATLSMALKVPIKKLEALEADDWASLPDPVFVRALATSVCRHIKTDSAPVLAALPTPSHARLVDDRASRGLNQSFRAPSDPKPSLIKFNVSLPMVLAAMVLLMAAIVMIFLPDFRKKNDAKNKEVIEAVVAPMSQSVSSSASTVLIEPVAKAESAPAPVAATLQVTAVAPAVIAPAPQVPVAMPASRTAIAAPASSNAPALRLVAKGVVWIEVKDAKGTVLSQRTMQPKEVLNVSGTAPLAVVVGRINEMQSIEVRGKPFSLAGLSPDNVARFEVK